MKAKYPEAYEALVTHQKRYEILCNKLVEHTKDTAKSMNIDMYNVKTRLDILHDMVDTLIDINGDYINILKEMERNRNIAQTALRTYAEFYGKELIVPEGFIDFDSKFNMRASVIPTKGKTTITVEVEEITE